MLQNMLGRKYMWTLKCANKSTYKSVFLFWLLLIYRNMTWECVCFLDLLILQWKLICSASFHKLLQWRNSFWYQEDSNIIVFPAFSTLKFHILKDLFLFSLQLQDISKCYKSHTYQIYQQGAEINWSWPLSLPAQQDFAGLREKTLEQTSENNSFGPQVLLH